jgi:hypothetical protein
MVERLLHKLKNLSLNPSTVKKEKENWGLENWIGLLKSTQQESVITRAQSHKHDHELQNQSS